MNMEPNENAKYSELFLVDVNAIGYAATAVKTAELLEKAKHGDPLAQLDLGYIYMGKDWAKAFDWFSESASHGTLKAIEMLGVCYSNGHGVEKDEELAVTLWEKVLEKETSFLSLFELGDCYLSGAGCVRDPEKGTRYLQKAVEQGFWLAEGLLGLCYLYGDGVEQNEQRAVELLAHYCDVFDNPSPFVMCVLGNCFKAGTGITQDLKKAENYYLRAAGMDYAPAEDHLLDLYMENPENTEQALSWMKKIADRKDRPDMMVLLGHCYLNGSRLTDKDPAEAVRWFRTAAETEDASAICDLGTCYFYGEGVEKDREKAMELFFKSANAGCAKAQDVLGQAYSKGIFVEKDIETARGWYQKAAQQGNEQAQRALEELDAK